MSTIRPVEGEPALHLRNSIPYPGADVFGIRFAPEGTSLACACNDGTVKVFHAASGRLLQTFSIISGTAEPEAPRLPTTVVRFRPSTDHYKVRDVLIAASTTGDIRHYRLGDGALMSSLHEDGNEVYCLDVSSDAMMFATGGRDTAVRLYDEETKALLHTMKEGNGITTAGHTNRIYSVKFHPADTNMLVSAGWDSTIQLWDLRSGRSEASIHGAYVCGDALDIYKDKLLCGSWRPDKQLQLYDLRKLSLSNELVWTHTSTEMGGRNTLIYSARFGGPSAKYIAACGSGANEVKLFNSETGNIIGSLASEESLYTLDFAPNGAYLACSGAKSPILLAGTTVDSSSALSRSLDSRH